MYIYSETYRGLSRIVEILLKLGLCMYRSLLAGAPIVRIVLRHAAVSTPSTQDEVSIKYCAMLLKQNECVCDLTNVLLYLYYNHTINHFELTFNEKFNVHNK